jgi:uncharacterized membrane protein YccC
VKRKYGTLSIVSFIAAGLALVAIADWPYGFYMLLRLVVTAAACAAAFAFWEPRRPALLVLAVGLGLLFQPLVKVAFEKDVWRVLDVGAAVLLVWFGFATREEATC